MGFELEKSRLTRKIGIIWYTNRVVGERSKLGSHVIITNTLGTFKRRLYRFSPNDYNTATAQSYIWNNVRESWYRYSSEESGVWGGCVGVAWHSEMVRANDENR